MDEAALLNQVRWTNALTVGCLALGVPVMAGYVWLTVRAYRSRDTAVGVLFTGLFVLIGGGWVLGVLLGLVLGWVFARRWQVVGLMTWWTAAVLVSVTALTVAMVMRHMNGDEWQAAFGWLPPL